MTAADGAPQAPSCAPLVVSDLDCGSSGLENLGMRGSLLAEEGIALSPVSVGSATQEKTPRAHGVGRGSYHAHGVNCELDVVAGVGRADEGGSDSDSSASDRLEARRPRDTLAHRIFTIAVAGTGVRWFIEARGCCCTCLGQC